MTQAQHYQARRNWLVLINIVLTCALLVVIMVCNFQKSFLSLAQNYNPRFIQILVFFLCFSIYFFIFQFPLQIYSGYILERKYQLSNQSFLQWMIEVGKKSVLSFTLSFFMIWILYELIWVAPNHWWFWAWLVYAFFSYAVGKLFPVLIVPLFYKYTPIQEGQLKEKIVRLANRFGMAVENIYSLNLSKTTKKANAAFCGIGRTKRIVLGDTLIENFSEDEIEMVLAHELGHFKNHDIWKQLIIGLATSLALFFASYQILSRYQFGRNAIEDLLFLPHLCVILYVSSLLLGPLMSFHSRFVEREADRFALKAIPNKEVFISTMEKLCSLNLADPNPHPVVEFLLYDHPSIGKRIQFANEIL